MFVIDLRPGRGSRGAGRGRSGHGNFGKGEDGEEQGHAKVLIGEMNMGVGDEDGEDKE